MGSERNKYFSHLNIDSLCILISAPILSQSLSSLRKLFPCIFFSTLQHREGEIIAISIIPQK